VVQDGGDGHGTSVSAGFAPDQSRKSNPRPAPAVRQR
jgi:hypothetical protein